MTGVLSLAQKGQDGDPIDALAVHDGATYPGVTLPCRPLGVVDLVQDGAKGANRKSSPHPYADLARSHGRIGEGYRPARALEGRDRAISFSARLSLRTSRRRLRAVQTNVIPLAGSQIDGVGEKASRGRDRPSVKKHKLFARMRRIRGQSAIVIFKLRL
jgi:Inorganic pyrophosphatase